MDRISVTDRSRVMSRIKSRDTAPERLVRSALHRAGFRFRLHDRRLPGTPDLVFRRLHTVVFVHGCFWHRHPDCPRAYSPSSNLGYWGPKFERTLARDAEAKAALEALGWVVVTVWECQLTVDGLSTVAAALDARRAELAAPEVLGRPSRTAARAPPR